jgi:hypothetical protein
MKRLFWQSIDFDAASSIPNETKCTLTGLPCGREVASLASVKQVQGTMDNGMRCEVGALRTPQP